MKLHVTGQVSRFRTKGRRGALLSIVTVAWLTWVLFGMALPSLAAPFLDLRNTVDFHIPAQSLDRALRTFAKQSETSVLYKSDLTRAYQTSPIIGPYSLKRALDILLLDTNLAYRETTTGSLTIEESSSLTAAQHGLSAKTNTSQARVSDKDVETLPEVLVPGLKLTRQAYSVPNATTATKINTPIMQTPSSIQVVAPQALKDQQATKLERVLENVSGVYQEQGFNLTNVFNVRGFRTFTYYRDGMPIEGALTQAGTREIGNIERVEVLKGPASFLYGRINPGGLVNLVTKQPLDHAYYSLQQQFESYQHYRTTADATGPLTKDKTVLYRFNFTHESFDSFRDFVDGNRLFIAPVVQWNISDRTQITFELEYQENTTFLDYGIPAVGDRPADLPRSRHLGGEPFNKDESKYVLGGFHWSHAFDDNWSLQHRFNALHSKENGTASFPLGVGADGQTLTRTVSGFKDNKVDAYYTTINLNGSFETLGFKHTLLIGGDYYNFTTTNVFFDGPLNSVNIFNPMFSNGPATVGAEFPVDIHKERYGAYIQDQIELPFNVFLMAGGRFDFARVEDRENQNKQNENALKPRVGLLWQALPQLSFFGSYVEGFGSDDFFIVNPDGSTLDPDTSQQWEAGIKAELFNGRVQGTLSFYHLTKQNIDTPDPNRPAFSGSTGEARNRGIELDVTAEIFPGWRTIGVYSYIDSNITKDNSGNKGNRFSNVPRHGGSFWTTYTLQENTWRGLTLGAGVIARSEREADNANTVQMPGYALLHLLSSYSWNFGPSRMTAQLNVNNVLNKKYFPSSLDGRNRIDVGAPRLFMGLLRAEFGS